MKTNMLISGILGLALSLLVSAAHADVLTGKLLSCSFDESQGFGPVEVSYRFITDQNGQGRVARFSSLAGNDVVEYSLNGSTLKINDPNDSTIVYDLSDVKHIKRKFSFCVSPGVPDGDSHSSCEHVVETCQLK